MSNPQPGNRIAAITPLTPLQRGLLFHAVAELGEDPYVVQVTARIDGTIDPAQFRAAWRRLAEQHAALRTGFVTKGQREPVQVTFESLEVPLQVLDWRALTPAEIEAAEKRLLEDDRRRGFPLNRPPLVRVTVAQLGDASWWVLLTHHHLILDGWSQPILFADLFALLAHPAGPAAAVLPKSPAFSDYVAWLRKQDREAAAAFWRDRLADWEPTAFPRSTESDPAASTTIERALDPRATAAIEQLARTCRVTASTVYQAAWGLVLERYLGRPNVMFGVTVSGRTAPLPGIELMVGMLINTLPIRLRIPRLTSVRAWLTTVQDEFRAAEAYAHTDLADLGAMAGATPDHPLFDTLVAYENFPVAADAAASAGLRLSQIRAHERTNLAIAVVIVPGAAATIRFQIDPAKVAPSLAAEMAELLASTLGRMTADPDAPVASVDAVEPPGVRVPQLAAGDRAETIVTRFTRAVAAHAERRALSGPGGDFTYRELDAASDRLAAALLHRCGKEDRVALCFERSTQAVVAMLAVLKLGAAYVPIDPQYPADRIAFTVRDSGAALVLASPGAAERAGELGCPTFTLETLAAATGVEASPARPRIDGANAAYVIYTSGSTGRPKGVVITHANVLRLFDGAEPLFDFLPGDVWSVFHSFAFDFSVWEIWGALLHGGRATIVSHDVSRDPAAFRRLLVDEGVTMLSQTPSAFGQLSAADSAGGAGALALRDVVFGGEALNPAALRPWFARHGDRLPRLVNMYGITETTVHVTFGPVTASDAGTELSPIGKPMPQLDVLLLDELGRPVPDGVPGEICVAGDGLARGYLGRPGLTAERFVPHPWPHVPGERLYRSGDLARRLPDGHLDYLGRIDRQVKVRGFRIELAEIEAALLADRAVSQVTVVTYAKARSGDEPAADGLCAYVVADERVLGPEPVEHLRTHVAGLLPAYMIPDAFVLLAALPLTVNGKVDVGALPDPELARHRSDVVESPATAIERVLAQAWAKGLGVERVGVTENYFALGGDSIRSIRIAGLAAEAGVHFTVRQLLEHPTVRALAAVAVERASGPQVAAAELPFRMLGEDERASLPDGVVDAYPLARLQAGMIFHADADGRGLYLDIHSFRLAMPIDEVAFRAAVDQTVAAHEVLRTGFLIGHGRRPLQFVVPAASMPLDWIDVRHVSPAERERTIAAYLSSERGRPYDLDRAPLARMAVHRVEDGVLQLTVSVHHAILDGWSVALWEAELLERYFAVRAGLPLAPAVAAPAYAQFVAAEQAAVDDPNVRSFWEARIAASLPTVVPRWHGDAAAEPAPPHRFPQDVAQRLVEHAATAGLPLKAVLLGIVGHAVCRSAGMSTVPVGLVTNGRPEVDGGDRAVGLFLNTIPVLLTQDGTWRELAVAAMAEETAVAGARRFPLQELVHLNGGAAPFECNFNFVHFHGFGGLSERFPVTVVSGTSVEAVDIPFSFNFTLDPQDGGLTFQLLSGNDVPKVQRDWLTAAVRRAVEAAASSLDAPADVFDPRTVAELTAEPNRTQARFDATPVHVRALARLAQRAEEPVLRDETGALWNGAAVSTLVDDVACRLGERVERGTPVLLWLPRSPALVAAMLATLRAGGAYVPVDPTAPVERVVAMLEQLVTGSRPPLILCTQADTGRLPESWHAAAVAIDAQPARTPRTSLDRPVDAGDLAYVIFTSGSTGRPKGVMIPHGGLANHMGWMASRFPLEPADVVLQRTNAAFDAAVWEFWAPLLEGALLALAPPAATKDPQALLSAVADAEATVVQMVPSLLEGVLSLPQAGAHRLRRLFCGGEGLRADLAADARRRFADQVINLYGPTEATIDATFAVAEESGERFVPIGAPVANMRAYILNERLELVPPGAPGELCLSGPQLAWGYAGMSSMSADRFIPDPFEGNGARLYRTGDVVRRGADGALHFMGRVDRQVKIGGNRLELEEVEAVIARHPQTARVAVATENAGGALRLLAYLEGNPDEGFVATLQAWLAQRLPAYAVPRRFAFVSDWPTLASGKTDAARLGALASAMPSSGAPSFGEALRGTRERAMAALWEEVLSRPGVGALDDFFALGGDSIVALQLAARARRGGFAVSPGDLFRNPTVRALCAFADTAAVTRETPPPLRDPVPVPPIARWFFDLHLARPNHWNQAVLLRVPKGLSLDELRAHLATLAARHDALRLRFTQASDGWTMQAGTAAIAVDAADVEDAAAVTAMCLEAQRGLDVEHGPLFHARLLRYAGDDADRLLLAGHHAIVDGVSWRVLFDELGALLSGHDIATEAPYPFTCWAAGRALQAPTAEETSFWKVESAYPLAQLPRANPEPPLEGRTQSLQRVLNPATTALLLGSARERLRADMAEIVLGALGQGLGRLMGEHETGVVLERHGRDVIPGADVSHTIGWFTVLHPVRLALRQDPADALRAAKEALRRVPNGGAGYFTLAAAGTAPRLPEVSLNYLGRFDASFTGALRPAGEDAGPASDPANQRSTVLDVVGLIEGGGLRLSASFDAHVFATESASLVLDEMHDALGRLAALAAAPAIAAWEGDDVAGWGVSAAQLRRLAVEIPDLEAVYPASQVQRGILFQSRLAEPGSGVYVQQVIADIAGPLDAGRLTAAWSAVAARHEALRSSFIDFDETQLQVVHGSIAGDVSALDWSQLAPDAQAERWERLLADERARGFDPARGPLSRIVVVRLAPDAARLLWTHHHLIMDGWSLPIVFADLLEAYRSGAALPPGPTLSPVVRWRLAIDREALLEEAAGDLKGFAQPSLMSKSPQRTAHAASVRELELEPRIVDGLARLTRAAGVSTASAINAGFALVLGRHLRRSDVVHGVTVSGRSADVLGIEQMVGLFIATVPLRTVLRGDQPVIDVLRATHRGLGAVNERALLPLGELQARVGVGSLFDSIVVFENYPVSPAEAATGGPLDVRSVTAVEQNHYPLSLYVHPGSDRLKLALHFDPGQVAAGEAEGFLHALAAVFSAWSSGAQYVGSTPILDPHAQTSQLALSAGPALPVEESVEERIWTHVAGRPGAPALMAGGRTWTYAEVWERAGRLAAALQARGIGPEDRVAVQLAREADLPVALLAVMRAGAAFIPLDPAFPPARLAAIIEDAAPKLLVTAETVAELLAESSAGIPDGPPAPLDGLAYVIFTSGSTGRPKGVEISRRAFANACAAFSRQPGLHASDVVAAVTTVSFDIALNELLLPWTVGAAIALVDRSDAANGVQLGARLAEAGATMMQATPTTWRLLAAAGWPGTNRLRAWCGGESLADDLAADLVAHTQEAWNVYGPTETTIWSTAGQLDAVGRVDAGTAIDNTTVYIVDEDGQLLPRGVAGQLLIGGAGVARGYAGKPGLTAAAFTPDPFAGRPGAVAYHTGDLARWSAQGRLEILGRLDRQVKISGYRVEPAEVEVALRTAPGVTNAACAVREISGAPALVAFVVAAEPALDLEIVRRHVQDRLPAYMVPAVFVPLDGLPLTPNGKVDYGALPDQGLAPRSARTVVEPRDPVEQALLLIWHEAFARTDFGVCDDFFDLGGHSLLATQIHAKLGRVFAGQVPLRDLFDAPTIEKLAARLSAAELTPGAVRRAAELFVRLRRMSPQERAALLSRARKPGEPVGA